MGGYLDFQLCLFLIIKSSLCFIKLKNYFNNELQGKDGGIYEFKDWSSSLYSDVK